MAPELGNRDRPTAADDYVRRLVDGFPPLSADQKALFAILLDRRPDGDP
jgi:hypothetical protein